MEKTEKTKAVAAAKAGMTEKTARKYLKIGKSPSQSKKERNWRTREDPFEAVWQTVTKLLEVDKSLQAKSIFDYLCRTEKSIFQEGQLRTLQRRIKNWKATEGPVKEVMFPQVHDPGVQCQSDYTYMNELKVTINNQPFNHMFYHFVLSYSKWEWGQVCYSESLESLRSGLQNALWKLGSVPQEHRTDNLSAAVNNLQDRKEFNLNYQELIDHYGLRASRNNPGKGNENGVVEQSHYRFKSAVDQELMLRGSRDFESREGYESFLRDLMIRRNEMRSKKLAEECEVLRELPRRRLDDFTEGEAKVSKFSTISAKKNIYSVDSRLIGESVKLRFHADQIEVRYGGKCIESLPRLRGEGKHRIQYRHIIDTLVKKPGAFANYKYHEDLFPRFMFRLAYDWMRQNRGQAADREYVKLLWMAAKQSEEKVDQALRCLLREGKSLDLETIKNTVARELPPETILVLVPKVELETYDELLTGVNHG